MLNYIKAELYRNFNRAFFWTYSGVIAALALMMNIAMKGSNGPNVDLSFLFNMLTQMLILPVFLVAAFIDITTGEEQKNLTLKNAVAFGVPRSKIALSKVIVTVILSFIAAFIIFTIFLGSGAVLFGVKGGTLPAIGDASLRILTALPLWIGAISVGTFIALFFNNNTAAAFVYAGVFTLISPIVNLLTMLVSSKFSYISKILITAHLSNLKQPNLGSSSLISSAALGIAYTILFTALGMLYIKRKEIK